MTGNTARSVGTLKCIHKERGIAHNGIIAAAGKLLQRFVEDGHPFVEHRPLHIASCLVACAFLYVYRRHICRKKPLRHHHCDKSRTGTDIQYTHAALRPCTQQDPVCTNLHGTDILPHGELLEFKKAVRHITCKNNHLFSHRTPYYIILSVVHHTLSI